METIKDVKALSKEVDTLRKTSVEIASNYKIDTDKLLDELIIEDQAEHPELTTAAQKPPVSQRSGAAEYWLGPTNENSIQGENEA